MTRIGRELLAEKKRDVTLDAGSRDGKGIGKDQFRGKDMLSLLGT